MFTKNIFVGCTFMKESMLLSFFVVALNLPISFIITNCTLLFRAGHATFSLASQHRATKCSRRQNKVATTDLTIRQQATSVLPITHCRDCCREWPALNLFTSTYSKYKKRIKERNINTFTIVYMGSILLKFSPSEEKYKLLFLQIGQYV